MRNKKTQQNKIAAAMAAANGKSRNEKVDALIAAYRKNLEAIINDNVGNKITVVTGVGLFHVLDQPVQMLVNAVVQACEEESGKK